MFAPITVRLSEQMHREIDAIVAEQELVGIDKSTVIRQLLAEGLAARQRKSGAPKGARAVAKRQTAA